MTTRTGLGSAYGIAFTAGGAFAAFYIFYTAAPTAFADSARGPGVLVAVVMLTVVAVQPLVFIQNHWNTSRRQTVITAITLMGAGSAATPYIGHWPGPLVLAAGFGLFVVASTAWIKETAPPELLGKALGIYGFGSAIGGALGAPIGVYLIARFGLTGTSLIGAMMAFASILPTVTVRATTPGDSSNQDIQPELTPPEKCPSQNRSALLFAHLAAHLLAVTIYATVLTSLADTQNQHSAWSAVGAVFAVQTSLAIGRMLAGATSTRWSPARTGLPALTVLIMSLIGFTMTGLPLIALVFSVLVGVASGACQTAVLTSLMKRARTTTGVNRASVAWNVCFDFGLGLGALTAGSGGANV